MDQGLLPDDLNVTISGPAGTTVVGSPSTGPATELVATDFASSNGAVLQTPFVVSGSIDGSITKTFTNSLWGFWGAGSSYATLSWSSGSSLGWSSASGPPFWDFFGAPTGSYTFTLDEQASPLAISPLGSEIYALLADVTLPS